MPPGDNSSVRSLRAEGALIEKDGEKDVSVEDGKTDAPPDGGLAAWSVVLGAWCTSYCSFGWLNSRTIQHSFRNIPADS